MRHHYAEEYSPRTMCGISLKVDHKNPPSVLHRLVIFLMMPKSRQCVTCRRRIEIKRIKDERRRKQGS